MSENHTRNEYKKKIGKMSKEQLNQEIESLNGQLFRARAQQGKLQNPYGTSTTAFKYNVKLLHWMRGVCIGGLSKWK